MRLKFALFMVLALLALVQRVAAWEEGIYIPSSRLLSLIVALILCPSDQHPLTTHL